MKSAKWETANAWWFIEIHHLPQGFQVDYYGTTPKFAQVKPPGTPTARMHNMGDGKLQGENLETLMDQVRRTVEAIDGPIERES